MTSENRINTVDEVHQYLLDQGEVTYSYEISETLTRDHGDMFEVYLCHRKRNELTSALLVMKSDGEIIPTGTDTSADYYIAEVRAGRWGNCDPDFDEDELLEAAGEPEAKPGEIVIEVDDDAELIPDP